MNPDYLSPEDSNPAGQSPQIEQQLKQLQPRPATFDAETILSAAREADQQVALADRVVRDRGGRRGRWLTISTAFACGAVAGTLLTCLMLIRGDVRDSATINDGKKAGTNVSAEGKNDTPNEVVDEIRQEDVSPDSQWSRSDWLIAAQLLEIRNPRLRDEPPLMAGNYVLHSTSIAAAFDNFAANEHESPRDLHGSNGHASEETNPTRSMDRKQLLRELLGTGPSLQL
ncbi:MAG: hypothetical protein IH991_17570 [Planctomycetes bacterium]|nr:hypothetical protein [Planctomycetota bacterium]